MTTHASNNNEDHHDRDHYDHDEDPLNTVEPDILAAIDLWHVQHSAEAMPGGVRERALRSMQASMGDARGPIAFDADARRTDGGLRHRPWLKPLAIIVVAGAAVAAAAWVVMSDENLSEQRDAFIARNPDAVVATLRLQAQPEAHCGNVAWSPGRHRIYLFAAGLPANPPGEHRYTLRAKVGQQTIEIARFDVTNPVDEIVRLDDVPELGAVERFIVTLDAVGQGVEPSSVEVAATDAF